MKKKLMRLLMIGAVLILSFGALSACGSTGLSSGDDSGAKVTKKKADKLTIGVSISTLSNPAFITLKNKIQDYAKSKGTTVKITDAQNDTAKQNNDIEDYITKKVDAIIVNPCDAAAITTAVKSANEANIPVVCVDRSSDGGKVLTTVATDSVKGGEMAAEHLYKELGKNAKIAEVTGIPGASATRERGKGFDGYAKGKMNIVTKQTGNFDRAKTLTVTENILQAHGDIVGIFAQNDEEAVGAANAVQAAGKGDQIKIIGFDGADAALKMIEKGQINATIAQRWDVMGTRSLDAVYNHFQGKKVPKKTVSPIKLVTKDNVTAYMASIK
ncbi:substrate-binding domain-containing protein [Lacticaseibacillus paracasei]|uniref:substrate-binding domain-containing protein n=1 Tax=Lacticaseibacillus paracasei TaxID=1597 RepID=UPI0014038026|nr:substrate-binding domain-containing protein [Lacticaseibacillus paracasei]